MLHQLNYSIKFSFILSSIYKRGTILHIISNYQVSVTSEKMASKLCNKCQLTKAIYDLNHRSDAADGYMYICKSCNVEVMKQWRENNQDYVKARERNRIATNLQCRINKNIHTKLNKVLKRGYYSLRIEQIIGLNKPTYLEWLRYNFENEMAWANYGKHWQIDLNIPASAFDLITEER